MLKTLASRYGMRTPTSFARRFIAGETVDEAIAAARAVEAQGLLQTLDYLGESVAHAGRGRRGDARLPAGHRRRDRSPGIEPQPVARSSRSSASTSTARRPSTTCGGSSTRADGFFVRIDMENSPYTDVTLDIFETLWQQGYRNDRRRAAGGSLPHASRTSSA